MNTDVENVRGLIIDHYILFYEIAPGRIIVHRSGIAGKIQVI
jgi:hypothetical protein